MRLRTLLSVAALASVTLVARAETFNFTLNGGAAGLYVGSGTLTGTQLGSSGVYLVTDISGTGVTGLLPLGAFQNNDNLFYANAAPSFDGQGLGFTDQTAIGTFLVNLHSVGSDYFATVTEFNTTTPFTTTVPVDFTLAPTAAATPEPSSLMLLGTGVLAMVGAARRRLRG